MKNVLFALLTIGFVQTASAFQFREYDFQQVDCIGSNGVTYKIADDAKGNLMVETSLMGTKKMFYANFYISTWTNDFVVEMGSKSAYGGEFELIVPVSGVKYGAMQSVGTAWKTVLNSRYYLGTVSCSFTMNK